MEIGNQIKVLRAQRGLTQEALAAQLGVTAQAVSKWENGAAAPDISLLPAISAYFGVTIDELFALTDDQRVERIRNMLWDNRDIEDAVLDREAQFLRDKARREPKNGEPWTMLSWIENFQARAHRRRAESCAKEALARTSDSREAHGDRSRARRIREQTVRDFPDDWMAWTSLGDSLVFDGEYERALECYREAQRHQTHPKAFTDPFDAIAQTYERMGNIPAAIAANEALIAAIRNDWDTTQGETVDAVKREITRLQSKL